MIVAVTTSPNVAPVRSAVHSSTKVAVPQVPAWHPRFLQLLPAIRRHARACLHRADPAARQEALQEIVVSSLFAYARLVELGKEDLAYATPLAHYAVLNYRAGRRMGSRLNINDITSEYCRARKGVSWESLDQRDCASNDWREGVVESRQATPAEVAATRIDFEAWLQTLSPRNRLLAESLASGETTSDAARAFGLSRARISQLRAELRDAWHSFQGEPLVTIS